jgi:hypothetical protein
MRRPSGSGESGRRTGLVCPGRRFLQGSLQNTAERPAADYGVAVIPEYRLGERTLAQAAKLMSLSVPSPVSVVFCESPFVVPKMRNPLYRYLAEEDT